MGGGDAIQHGSAATVGEVYVEQDDVRVEGLDLLDRDGDVPGLSDDVRGVTDLGADTRADHRVVVDHEHPNPFA
jgi:hypothetical protein